jgi:signal transduction histidine kinase
MRYPRFIAEMGSEPKRRNLYMGVWSGYALVAAFMLLGGVAYWQRLIPWKYWFWGFVVGKLLTNTAALACLRARRWELESGGINVSMDVVSMTAAIYATGGALSPLFSMYVVELAVLALLTNLGITVLAAVSALALYAAVTVLVHLHVLPAQPAPVEFGGGLTPRYLATNMLLATFLVGSITIYSSLTLRHIRRQEGALEERTRDLADAIKQKGLFMANITHELRTPIHGIVGLVELIETEVYGPATGEQRKALAGITRSAENLLALIDELLLAARAEAGKLEYRPATVSLAEVVTSVGATGRWMLGTKNVRLDVAIPDDLPAIRTDRPMLVQILVNLLSNAIKFTPEGGAIAVRVERRGDGTLAVAVADTGIGIPDGELPHIFDAFRQVDGSAERRYGGTGLGLSVVKRLVDMIHASLAVESVEGRGSTFTLAGLAPATDDATAATQS